MSRRKLSRLVLVVLVVSALAVAGPARAQAADLVSPRSVWDRLAGVWQKGISALWPWSKAATDTSPDPAPSSQGSGTNPGVGTPQGDIGLGIDPNG